MQKKYNIVDHRLVEIQDGPALLMVFINPDDNEKRYLIEKMRLDEHTLQSALDPDELSRLEFEPEHLAMIFKRPKNYSHQDKFLFKVTSAGAFLFKDYLIIVASDDIALFDPTQLIRIETPAYLLLRLMYRSIFHFLEHLKVIAAISDDLQDKINMAMENKSLLNLFTLEKSLIYYLNSLNSNGAVLDKLRVNASKISLGTDEMEFLEDTIIENSQCYKQAEIYSNILASLMDARASIVSNNLNILIKLLNIITIAIMVPTFVVSAFSMNVGLPLQNHPLAFWLVMGLAFVSVLVFIMILRRNRW
ncbi:MAG: magnesium transporter CorA family protein [candidate division Zixibacteria bacterium]|nr:magnesium transporter CorA family protein [candidate division Zixibacteria bacterium]